MRAQLDCHFAAALSVGAQFILLSSLTASSDAQ